MATTDEAGARFALSMRTARDTRKLSREAVVYELTKLGNPVSVSTLLRWERDGSIKAEDAWYLSQVYGVTIDELLLSAEPEGVPDASPVEAVAEATGARPVGRAAQEQQKRRRSS